MCINDTAPPSVAVAVIQPESSVRLLKPSTVTEYDGHLLPTNPSELTAVVVVLAGAVVVDEVLDEVLLVVSMLVVVDVDVDGKVVEVKVDGDARMVRFGYAPPMQ